MSDEQNPDEPQLRVVDRRWWARKENAEAGAVSEPAVKPTYVEELERRLADQAVQLQNALTDRRRELEEFEQARLRIRRDVGREVERGKRAILLELLEVLDNLDRATASARTSASAEAEQLARGVELVRDQFLAKLQALGVTRLAVLGDPFDAARHEAVTVAPVEDPAQNGFVVAVLKEGYVIGDEVLRPASVVVGQHG